MTQIVEFTQNGRLNVGLGHEMDPSAIWTVEIRCDERMGRVLLRLTDQQAAHSYSHLVSNPITAATYDIDVSPSSDVCEDSTWAPLIPNHFLFGLGADILRRSKMRLVDINGVRAFLLKALKKHLDAAGHGQSYIAVVSQQTDLQIALGMTNLSRGSRPGKQATNKSNQAGPAQQISPTMPTKSAQPPATPPTGSGAGGAGQGSHTVTNGQSKAPARRTPSAAPSPRLPRRNSELKKWF